MRAKWPTCFSYTRKPPLHLSLHLHLPCFNCRSRCKVCPKTVSNIVCQCCLRCFRDKGLSGPGSSTPCPCGASPYRFATVPSHLPWLGLGLIASAMALPHLPWLGLGPPLIGLLSIPPPATLVLRGSGGGGMERVMEFWDGTGTSKTSLLPDFLPWFQISLVPD